MSKKYAQSERELFAHMEAFGTPPGLRRRYRTDGFELDFAWPDIKFAIEADGLSHEFHPRVARRLKERARDYTLRQAGWSVYRIRVFWRRPEKIQMHVESVLALVYRLQAAA
jgi:very-short-patch-repair endonuclease